MKLTELDPILKHNLLYNNDLLSIFTLGVLAGTGFLNYGAGDSFTKMVDYLQEIGYSDTDIQTIFDRIDDIRQLIMHCGRM